VLSRLEDSGWVAREATADLLGAIPPERWPEALLDEVSELLQSRLDDDSDGDVRNAARAALGRLGRAPVVAEDEEESVEPDETDVEE
jgi:HEAT repeat protein